LRANAVRRAASTAFLFRTGRVPGIAQSNKETREFAGDANLLAEPEKSLELVLICA
jgi:hypothetical protein